jgi:hypothetical protein
MHFPRAPYRGIARAIREAAGGLPVYAMARFVSAADAEAALAAGDADLVGMSRALVADPDLPDKARAGRLDEIRPCIGCNVCWGAIPLGKPILCIYNPSVGHEGTIDADAPPPAPTPRCVVIAGGGLAGLEAARVAALRGHRVILLERATALGGQARLAERLPGRRDFGEMTRWLVRQVERLPVEVRLGTAATAELVQGLAPDAVVVATGSVPLVGAAGEAPGWIEATVALAAATTGEWASDGPPGRPPAPLDAGSAPGGATGAGGVPAVWSTWQVIDGTARLGARVALVDREGEHEGAGAAELLADRGHRVWYVSPFDLVGFSMNYLSRIGATRRLLQRDVTVLTASEPRRFDGRTLEVEHLYSRRRAALGIDSIVLAGPNRAVSDLAGALAGRGAEVHVIGDAYAPRKAAAAVHEGHRVGRLL